MELYLQSVALILISAVLGLLLKGYHPSFMPILSLTAGCLVLAGLVRYLQPVAALLRQIRDLADISSPMLSALLKAVGISLIAQLTELICRDAGQNALGKVISMLSNAAILWVSLPLIEALLELMQEVLGK